jgi:hypothetical protein
MEFRATDISGDAKSKAFRELEENQLIRQLEGRKAQEQETITVNYIQIWRTLI